MAEHGETVCAVAFSMEGERVASGSVDGCLKIWDTTTGVRKSQIQFQGNNGRLRGCGICAVAFSPLDGRMVAVGLYDGTVRMCDTGTESATMVKIFPCRSVVSSVAFVAKSGLLVSGSADGHIRVWDTNMDTENDDEMNALSPINVIQRGGNLVSTESRLGLELWNVATGKARKIHHPVKQVVFSPDDTLVALITEDATVHFWSTDMTDEKATFNHVDEVTFSQDGGMVALQLRRDNGGERVRVLETNMWGDKTTSSLDQGKVYGVKFSPTNQVVGWIVQMVTGSFWKKFLHFENLETGKVLPEIPCSATTRAMKFSPNGEFVTFPAEGGSRLNRIVLLEIATGYQRCLLEGEFHPDHLAFNPDSSHFATWSHKGDILVTKTSTGETKHTIKAGVPGRRWNMGSTHSPTGKITALWFKRPPEPCIRIVQLWDALTGDEIGKLRIHADKPRLSFSDDAAHLVTEMGLLPLPPASPWIPSDGLPEGTQDCLYVDRHRQRIVQGFGNLLWLPPAYHTEPDTTVVRGNSVVLGHKSGRITFFEFDLSNTPLVRRPQGAPV